MTTILQIENTLGIICNCWNEAELALRKEIKEHLPDKGETFITEYFHGLLEKSLKSASEEKKIENAFIQDLKKASVSSFYWANESQRIAEGLIAEMELHTLKTEEKTGGDFGFVISRPKLLLHGEFSPDEELIITENYRRGLLTQAKLKNDKGKWNDFTKIQKNKLPQHLEYLALLLYEYQDKNRRDFEKFKWQLCAGSTFEEVKRWLKTNNMPTPFDSNYIINNLGTAKIGTEDENIIKEVICPPQNQTLTIHIHWPGGDPPISRVRIRPKTEVNSKSKDVCW